MSDEQTAAIVNQLFDRLIGICPAFRSSWPTDAAFEATKREWVIAFKEANIHSIEYLAKGLTKVRHQESPYVPSPGQFIAMCKPEPQDLGAPTLDKAYQEACEKSHPAYGPDKNWSHVAVRNAAREVGSHALSTEPATKTKPLFKKAFEQSLKDYSEGKTMDQLENHRKDNWDNRRKYQIYWGELQQKRKFAKNPGEIEILSYEEWFLLLRIKSSQKAKQTHCEPL